MPKPKPSVLKGSGPRGLNQPKPTQSVLKPLDKETMAEMKANMDKLKAGGHSVQSATLTEGKRKQGASNGKKPEGANGSLVHTTTGKTAVAGGAGAAGRKIPRPKSKEAAQEGGGKTDNANGSVSKDAKGANRKHGGVGTVSYAGQGGVRGGIRERLAPNSRQQVKVEVHVYQDAYKKKTEATLDGCVTSHNPAMTIEQAMKEIGWEVVAVASVGDKGQRPEYEHVKSHLTDVYKNKIILGRNRTNRPFRPGLARRYMLEILRGKWALNGETLVFDWDNMAQSAQHRLVGFILAEQVRKKQPDKWAKYGWKGPITMECIVVKGINPHPDVTNTLDLGQKRTFGDVIYRDSIFGGADISDAVKKKLSNILGGAVRLVWLRSTNKKVSDAPHFPISEGMDFIDMHPRIVEAVDEVWKMEGGLGQDGGKISRFLPLAYASGLFYLMATSGTDRDQYDEIGPAALDFSMIKKAREFWRKFAAGTELKANDPVYIVREMLPDMDKGSAQGRDEVASMVIKAFNYWADDQTADNKKIRIPKKLDPKTGKERLAEDPRLGGLDVEGRDNYEEPSVSGAVDADREGSKAGKGWAEGDEAWVKCKDGEHWFGVIDSVYKACDGDMRVLLTDVNDGKPYDEPLNVLCLKYPK